MILALSLSLGHPITGTVRWTVLALALIPSAAVHWHDRDRDMTWRQNTLIALLAACVAYTVIILGLTVGAAATLGVVIAAKAGALTAAADLCTILAVCFTRRRAANA